MEEESDGEAALIPYLGPFIHLFNRFKKVLRDVERFMDFTNHRSDTKIDAGLLLDHVRPEVWQADSSKVTFVSGQGIDSGGEVFNNYGDKILV